MGTGTRLCAIAAAILLAAGAPGAAAEAPKRGAILTYMIAADAPPSFDAHREGTFATIHPAARFSLYTANYGNFEDRNEVDLYQKMLHETDPVRQRALLRDFEKHMLDDQAHEIFMLWQHRIVPHRAYLKGWKIGGSFYINQDLARIWLDQ